MAASASERHQGGFFTNALIAEYPHEFGAPCPAGVNENRRRGLQNAHDFFPVEFQNPAGRAFMIGSTNSEIAVTREELLDPGYLIIFRLLLI
jgi:hypothetical protein